MSTNVTVLRQTQLIHAALLGGCVLFGIVILIATNNSEAGLDGGGLEILNTVGAVVGATSIPMAFFLRRQIWSRRSTLEGEARDNAFRIGVIVFMGILEGAILLNLVVWLVNGNANSPAIQAGILLFIGVLGFPRQGHLETF